MNTFMNILTPLIVSPFVEFTIPLIHKNETTAIMAKLNRTHNIDNKTGPFFISLNFIHERF